VRRGLSRLGLLQGKEMILRIAITAALAGLAAALIAGNAEAGKRLKYFVIGPESYYPGPEFIPPPRYYRYYRYFVPGDGMTPEEYEEAYGRKFDFEEDYYEPEYQPPAAVRRKPVATATTTTGSKTEEKVASTSAKATGPLTCAKAGNIVSGYGFTSVKSSSCTGKVYSFTATRDGKAYAIRLDAASGELTEVRKVQ
jgi:hypothetical protein